MWIESHQSLRNHRKTGRLARRLGIGRVAAIGHLHCFWWWCMDNAPTGSLAGIDAEDIADGAEWEGDPADFIAALDYAGFIEGEAIHDWYDYAGKLIERRQKDAARKRESRHPADDPPTKPLRNGDVQRTSDGHPADGVRTVPNRTQPNHTEPDQENVSPPSAASVAAAPRHTPKAPTPLRPAPKPKDAPPKERPRDLLFEAVCEVCLIDWHHLTERERGKYNAAVGQIRGAGGTPDAVPIHAANYRAQFSTPLTPMALAGNWAMTANSPPANLNGHGHGRRETLNDRNERAFQEAFGDEPADVPTVIEATWRRH
jgi:hypothetical protein